MAVPTCRGAGSRRPPGRAEALAVVCSCYGEWFSLLSPQLRLQGCSERQAVGPAAPLLLELTLPAPTAPCASPPVPKLPSGLLHPLG